MKRIKGLVAVVIGLLMIASVLPLSASAELPAIPKTGEYTIQKTVLQLTADTVSGQTPGTVNGKPKACRLVLPLKSPVTDLSAAEYLHFWIYVEDTALLNENTGDSIELCSGGKQDNGETAICFHSKSAETPSLTGGYHPLKKGWNEYLVDLDDFTVEAGGGLDRAALNFMAVVLRSTEPMTVAVGPVYAGKTADFVSRAPKDPETPSAEEEESATGKNAFGALLHDFEEEKKVVQNGTLRFSCEPEGIVPSYSYLCLEISVDRTDSLEKSGDLILESENGGILRGSIKRTELKKGWNTVFCALTSLRSPDASLPVCDLLHLKAIRLEWKVSAAAMITMKLGKITGTNSNVVSNLPAGKYAVRDTAVTVTTADCSGSAVASGKKQIVSLVPDLVGGSVDISAKKYLYFWLYVGDMALDGSDSTESLELCSGGTYDVRENALPLAASAGGRSLFGSFGAPKSGWNEYLVPVTAFTKITNKDGAGSLGCDFSALNYIRMYLRTAEDTQGKKQTYTLSVIYAVSEEDLEGFETEKTSSSVASSRSQNAPSDTPAAEKSSALPLIFAGAAVLVILAAVAVFLLVRRSRQGHPQKKNTDNDPADGDAE